ncbi:hypothetical protein GO497_02755 [Acidovorax citrulli]|nr:hypothetical protein [Paracidovorax citrulli]
MRRAAGCTGLPGPCDHLSHCRRAGGHGSAERVGGGGRRRASHDALLEPHGRGACAIPSVARAGSRVRLLGRLEWVPDAAELWGYVRARRDELLRACDWRVLPDAPTPADMRQAWLDYRQALRDVTGQGDPRAIEWPVAPFGVMRKEWLGALSDCTLAQPQAAFIC